jgi:LuxR family maltose regulon positive regulatory protein
MKGAGRRTGRSPFEPPHLPRHIALKPVVLERLDAATDGVGIVTAPAGYGKTTQAALWARGDGRPVAWLDLESNFNDAHVLLEGLVSALRYAAGLDLGPVAKRRLTDREYSTFVAPDLGAAMRGSRGEFILVLDDAHVLVNPAAIDLIDAVVHNVPAGATVVTAWRGRPAVHIGRLIVDGTVTEVTEDDLALDVDEARAVLQDMDVVATDDQLADLMERTEGWPVGVRLTAASYRLDRDGDRIAGSHPTDPVGDYVREEWLRGLGADETEFLVHASGLRRLTAPLCDAVVGCPHSAEMLERLATTRRLVLPLDQRAASFRVHPLLRRVLDEEFETSSPSARRAVDLRASEWFEAEGDIDGALRHAHRAGDLARAERLIGLHALAHHMDGQFQTVHRWLGSFPPGYAFTSVTLCVMAAVSAMAHGDGVSARSWLSFGERAVGASDVAEIPEAFHHLAVYRAILDLGPIGDVLPGAEQAYRALPPGTWHASSCLIVGASRFALGEASAEALLAEGAAEAKLSGGHSIEALCRAHLSIVLDESGDRKRSVHEARSARRILDDFRLLDLPTMALVVAVSSHVEASDGNLERARSETVLACRQLADLADAGPWANVQSRVALARTALILGDRVAARTFVEEAEVYVRRQPDALVPKAQLADVEHRIRAARRAIDHGPSALTNAELKVLHLLPTNLTLEGIADRLFVSRTTVNSHTRAIYRKLGTSTRKTTVDRARAVGLLPDEPRIHADVPSRHG